MTNKQTDGLKWILNQVHLKIQYTVADHINDQLPFLDHLIRSGNNASYKVHRKQINKVYYIHQLNTFDIKSKRFYPHPLCL